MTVSEELTCDRIFVSLNDLIVVIWLDWKTSRFQIVQPSIWAHLIMHFIKMSGRYMSNYPRALTCIFRCLQGLHQERKNAIGVRSMIKIKSLLSIDSVLIDELELVTVIKPKVSSQSQYLITSCVHEYPLLFEPILRIDGYCSKWRSSNVSKLSNDFDIVILLVPKIHPSNDYWVAAWHVADLRRGVGTDPPLYSK